MSELDGDGSLVIANDLPIDPQANFATGSTQQNSDVALSSRLQIRPDRQKAATDIEVANLLSTVQDSVAQK